MSGDAIAALNALYDRRAAAHVARRLPDVVPAESSGPFDVAGSVLVPARAPRAQVNRGALHVVPVLHSDVAPTRPALCGYQPKRYPWVLRPSWPDRDCPLCAERAAAAAAAANQDEEEL